MVPDWVSDLGQAGWAAPAADCRLGPSLFRGCLALWDQQLSRACPSHSNSRNTRVCCAHCLVVSLATPGTAALQAPLSVEFSRQEYWSGLPFLSMGNLPDPGMEPVSLAFPALVGGILYR